jgi:uncharacterized protein (DUF4213/DUF364 family)
LKMDRYDILKEIAKEKSKGASVVDYVMGIGLCAVTLDDGRTGVSYTDRKSIPWGCSLYDELPKIGVGVEEFIKFFDSSDVLLNALGTSAINACVNDENYENGDVMEAVNLSKDDVMGMVGYFDPMVSGIKRQLKTLYIFEKERTLTTWPQKALPPEEIPNVLPQCSVILVSATTVMNKSFDDILKYAKTKRIILLGPSTPMVPKAFPEVKVFGGTKVSPAALKTIAHGGGTRNLYREKVGKKVILIN